MSTSNYHLDDNMISQNYFYENDINSLKLNSMNMDMDVNNLEHTSEFSTSSTSNFSSCKNNTTSAFIDMIMMSDNMDFTEEAEDFNDDDNDDDVEEEVFDSINFNNTSSALSSTSSLSSIGFVKETRPSTCSPASRIKMQNSYILLKRRIMASHKRKHLNSYSLNSNETNFSNNENSVSSLVLLHHQSAASLEESSEKKRFRTRVQRVKHARKFYQRQRTSSTKLSIDLNDKLTKLHQFASTTTNENTETLAAKSAASLVNESTASTCVQAVEVSKNTNLKLYKPSFKVEKLLNDSRGMKKYLIDYDCLMKSNKQHVSKTFSLNNLSSIVTNNASSSYEMSNDFFQDERENVSSFSSIHLNKLLDLNESDNNLFDKIRSSFLKINSGHKNANVELTPASLNDCMQKKFKVDEQDEDHYYEEEEEIKSYSSFSNKCSSGYLSDF
jgi:hypothetical protein